MAPGTKVTLRYTQGNKNLLIITISNMEYLSHDVLLILCGEENYKFEDQHMEGFDLKKGFDELFHAVFDVPKERIYYNYEVDWKQAMNILYMGLMHKKLLKGRNIGTR